MNPKAIIKIKDIGEMEFELFLDTAPNSASNFIHLAMDNFYDGISVHRIIPGFVAQGGCPNGTGMGGPGYTIDGEFSSNNFDNPNKHIKGALSWARSQARNSAGSQFFMCLDDVHFLDPDYAVFGKILKGEEILDELAKLGTEGGKPTKEVYIEKVSINLEGNEKPELIKI